MSWESGLVFLIIWIFSFIWVIYFRVAWVFLTTLSTCRSSSATHLVVAISLTFKVSQGWRMYYSILSRQYPNFTLYIFGWSKFNVHVFVWILSLPLLMVILLQSAIPYFPRAVLISYDVAEDRSLLLITPLHVLSFLFGYTLHFIVQNVFI